MAEPIALVALILDAAIGWPDRLYARVGHPVGGFARAIGAAERRWNRPDASFAGRCAAGLLLMVVLVGATVVLGLALERLAAVAFGQGRFVAVALLAWPALAQRSLLDHVRAVAAPLRGGDLAAARGAVGRIVGRDTGALAESGVARAAIESLAESFCDGVVAPLFWLIVGGLPGIWAYKAINTADSLIGHREPRWRAFGWAAARGDDLANWLPARIAGVILCLAGGGGWRVLWRDHRRHASPNAGWPEAAMAGAIDVALAGPVAYDGVMQDKDWIHGAGRAAGAADLSRAILVYLRACGLLWLGTGAIAWLR